MSAPAGRVQPPPHSTQSEAATSPRRRSPPTTACHLSSAPPPTASARGAHRGPARARLPPPPPTGACPRRSLVAFRRSSAGHCLPYLTSPERHRRTALASPPHHLAPCRAPSRYAAMRAPPRRNPPPGARSSTTAARSGVPVPGSVRSRPSRRPRAIQPSRRSSPAPPPPRIGRSPIQPLPPWLR